MPVEARILQLMQHLGIREAHFGVREPEDYDGLVTHYPERISSMTLVCPFRLHPDVLRSISSRLLTIWGDPSRTNVTTALASIPDAKQVSLEDYPYRGWTDVVAERTDEIGAAMLEMMQSARQQRRIDTSIMADRRGEVAELTYEIRGSGEPLILLPLDLSPSQWDALLPLLSERYCTITVTGPMLGVMPLLELRGGSSAYRGLLRNMIEAVDLCPESRVLDVGCGTGVVGRYLNQTYNNISDFVGVDINNYLLREAVALAHKEGGGHKMEFRNGSAESLPFEDGTFDTTISLTVMEEVNAEKMLAEMIRVTKPGGKVGVIVRAEDMPALINIPLHPTIKAKCEVPLSLRQDEGTGCASVSLYGRFHTSVLTDIKMMPQLAVFDNAVGVVERFFLTAYVFSHLSPEEANEGWAAVEKAVADGTFFVTWPHHCAVGTKPE